MQDNPRRISLSEKLRLEQLSSERCGACSCNTVVYQLRRYCYPIKIEMLAFGRTARKFLIHWLPGLDSN